MMNIILYASQQDQNFQWVILAIAMLLIIGLIIMLLWQQRTGRELTTELAQLEKEKHRSVEFDFVLKAMGLSIWHINTDSGEIFFDKDFREKSEDQSIGIEGGSINDNSLLLVEEDATRINKALSDLCAGVTEEYHEQYRVKVAHSARKAMLSLQTATSPVILLSLWVPHNVSMPARPWRQHSNRR